MEPESMSSELLVLGLSVILLVVHTLLQGHYATRERGLDWNAGPRDGEVKPLGIRAGRAQRALDNYKETYPAYIALVLGLVASGATGGIASVGAWIWFLARIAYLPLYLFGVSYWRSALYGASMFGLLLMLLRFFFS